MQSYNYILLLCAGLLVSFTINAQEKITRVRLLDEQTFAPIVGASWQYEDQQGVTDSVGRLGFVFQPGAQMHCSHLHYGKWTLEEPEIRQMMQLGLYYRAANSTSLHPVTVLAVRPPETPNAAFNLSYQDHMAHDAAAILNQHPAISSIRKSGNYGFDPVFRGFKYDQLNIVLNGAQGATAACPNRMDPPTSQMAPNMMDRIEVLKGPHALRFGTGLGATINFVPAKLRFTDQPEVYGRLSGAYAQNGAIGRSEGLLGFSGNHYDLGLFASWSQGNDYKDGNQQSVPADFQRGSFGANLGLKIASNQQLRLSATYNRARDTDFPALPMDLREDDTWLFHARHDIQWTDRSLQSWNTTLFASFVDHLMDNGLKPLNPRMLNAATDATTHHYGGRTEGVWHFPKGKLYAGADFRVEAAEGIRSRSFLMGPNAGKTLEDNAWQEGQIGKAGLFAEYHLISSEYHWIFAGRIARNAASVQDAEPEFLEVYPSTEEVQINPSISLGVFRQFSEKVKLGLWLARAQRSGSLTERFINYFPVGQDPFEMLGNPQLDPEINHQLDLSFSWMPNDAQLRVDVFASFLQDAISSVIDTSLQPRLPMSPGVRQFVNIEEAFKTGFELSWTQPLWNNAQHQLSLAYTYAQDLERNEPLPEIPPLDIRYTLRAQLLKGRLQPEVTLRHVIEQNRVSQEFGETVTPAFTVVDVLLPYQLTEALRLSLAADNLLDAAYFEHLNRSVRGTQQAIFAPGRNIRMSFNWEF